MKPTAEPNPCDEVEYTQTLEDFRAYMRHEMDRLPTSRQPRLNFGLCCFCAWVLVLPIGYLNFHNPSNALLVTALPAIGVALVIQRVSQVPVKSWHLRQDLKNSEESLRPFLGRCSLRLSHDSFATASRWVSAVWRWDALEEIAQTEEYLFLKVIAQMVIIVPRAAFHDDSEFLGFIETIRKLSAVPATAITADKTNAVL